VISVLIEGECSTFFVSAALRGALRGRFPAFVDVAAASLASSTVFFENLILSVGVPAHKQQVFMLLRQQS